MINPEEYRAFMALLNVAGQENSDTAVAAINALLSDHETDPPRLVQWLAMAEIISKRADAVGYARGSREGRSSVDDAAPRAPIAPAPSHTSPIKGAKFSYVDVPDAPVDAHGVPHWRGNGTPVPNNVREYLRDQLRRGALRGTLRERFHVSFNVVNKLYEEVQAEKIAEVESRAGAKNEQNGAPAMPAWAVE